MRTTLHPSAMMLASFITDADRGERESMCTYEYFISNAKKDSPVRIKVLKMSEGQLEKHRWRGLIFTQLLITERATSCFSKGWAVTYVGSEEIHNPID